MSPSCSIPSRREAIHDDGLASFLVLLYGATTGYLLAGVVGLASIGLFLIVAGLLAFIGAGPRRVPVGVVAVVVAILASALIIGMALT